MILVGCNRREPCLLEEEGLEVLRGGVELPPGRDVDHVEPGLVPVHRVQDHLGPINQSINQLINQLHKDFTSS